MIHPDKLNEEKLCITKSPCKEKYKIKKKEIVRMQKNIKT